MTKLGLGLEFAVLFVLLPVIYRLLPWRIPPLPVLWLVMLYCLLMLHADPTFSAGRLWNAAGFAQIGSVLAIFCVAGIGILLGVRWLAPDLLFSLPRTRPALWALVMVLYPVLSVYPQSVVYRAFLMHRYTGLVAEAGFHGRAAEAALIVLSALAFGWMHMVFRNPLAVGMTLAGGLLFAWRYAETGSLAISSLEHALYGCLLFTAGLGRYFYIGAAGRGRL